MGIMGIIVGIVRIMTIMSSIMVHMAKLVVVIDCLGEGQYIV